MKNWKIIAIIVVTAVATAAAVAFVCQKMNRKRRLRFDSSEFDEKDYADEDEFEYGEQCSRCGDVDLDVQIPDESQAQPAEDGSLEEAAEIEKMLNKQEEAAQASDASAEEAEEDAE